jgi:hypothetical protein
MLENLLKLIGIGKNAASLVEYIIKAMVALGLLGGGGLMGISVYASALFGVLGWSAVFAAALLGALVVALSLWAAASAYRKYMEATALRAVEQRPGTFNPKLNHYLGNL